MSRDGVVFISLSAFVTKIDLLWPEAVMLSQASTITHNRRQGNIFPLARRRMCNSLREDGPVKAGML